MVATFEGNPVLVVISAYAPTNLAETNTKEAFFEQLRATVDSFPPHNLVVIAGDLNARIGHQPTSRMVGRFVYHHSNNDNGDKLLTLCEATNMFITQSRFPQPPGRLWTWMKPGKQLFTAQLDHILIRRKWINSARDCRAYNTVGVSSDHRILCAKLVVSLRASITEPKKAVRFETSRLELPGIQQRFEQSLASKYKSLVYQAAEQPLAQDKYDWLIQALTEAADESIGRKPRAATPASVSQATAQLIELKDHARQDYIAAPRRGAERASKKREWKAREREVEAAFIADHHQHLDKTLAEMQEAADRRQTAKVWKLLRKVVGDDARRPIVVKSKHANATQAKIMEEWRDYFSQLLNNRSAHAVEASPPAPAPSPDSNIITGPFSMTEITRAINNMNNNRVPGSDDVVTTELMKHGAMFIRGALLDLCNDVYKGAKPPWQWTTNRICPIPKKGNQTLMSNFRGISLMSTAAKIYNRMLLDRIRLAIDRKLRMNQASGKAGAPPNRFTFTAACSKALAPGRSHWLQHLRTSRRPSTQWTEEPSLPFCSTTASRTKQ